MKAVLKHIRGNQVVFELDEELDIRAIKRSNGLITADIEFEDTRKMTHNQRKKIFALFEDIQNYSGYEKGTVRDAITQSFEKDTGLDVPTLKFGGISISVANQLIEYIIKFCFAHRIPFVDRQYYLDSDATKILFYYLMHRKCFVCGANNAEVAHVEAVGAGRNRKTIDHTKHRLMALCHEHHREQHNTGIKTFMNKYHLQGIRLKHEQLKELGGDLSGDI